MTVAMPAGIAKAIDSLAQDVAYVCRRVWRCGPWSCGWRRACWWTGPRYIATATDSRTISEGVLVAPRGRPVLCNAWQSAIERRYEMRALVAQRETARLQHMAGQEIPRQRKSIGKIRPGWFHFPIPQERRQP
jgi:hypothetical protein